MYLSVSVGGLLSGAKFLERLSTEQGKDQTRLIAGWMIMLNLNWVYQINTYDIQIYPQRSFQSVISLKSRF